jgi:hypothetical protein
VAQKLFQEFVMGHTSTASFSGAREIEAALLTRCVAVARQSQTDIMDSREANVFRLASMVIKSQFPHESACLMQASDRYFSQWADQRVSPADVVQRGWVISLPRLRDMLSRQLQQG